MQNVALPSVPSSLLLPWADTDDHTTIMWLDQEPDPSKNWPSKKDWFSGWVKSLVLHSGRNHPDTYSRTQEDQGEQLAVTERECGTVSCSNTTELHQMELAV